MNHGRRYIDTVVTAALITLNVSITHNALGQLAPDTCITSTWSTDRQVNTVAHSNGMVYIGGNFTKIGRFTAGCALFDATTGVAETVFELDGSEWSGGGGDADYYTCPTLVESFSVCPDGKGGWYFQSKKIQHVFSNGKIDTNWLQELSCIGKGAILVKNNILYVGGNLTFPRTGKTKHYGLLALDAATGKVDTAGAPYINGSVYALSLHENILYAGGAFDSVGGRKQYNMAAIDYVTRSTLAWNPNPNPTGYVYAIASMGSVVLAGGVFIAIGGQGGPFCAALDSGTASALSWNANANNAVQTIAVSGNNIFIGGNFTKIGGQARNHIACLDATTGNALDWNPNADSAVHCIVVEGNTLYTGGKFGNIGGQPRNRIAAVHSSTGSILTWNPGLDSIVNAIAVNGAHVFAAGGFLYIGGYPRSHLAALDPKTGAATSWAPQIKDLNGRVNTIAISGNTVYVGGWFDSAGGQPRKSSAAFDAITGELTSWNPKIKNTESYTFVYKIAINGNRVYLGGNFDSVGGQRRNGMAAVDAITGEVSAWNPDAANGCIQEIVVKDNTLYVGGNFDSIGGQPRPGIAAFDIATGNITSWNPKIKLKAFETKSGWSWVLIRSILPMDKSVFIGGNFDTIDGRKRNYLALLDDANGDVKPWNPSPDGIINAMALSDTVLYVGGVFQHIGELYSSNRRNNLAAIGVLDSNALPWNPNPTNDLRSQDIFSIARCNNTIYAGGKFLQVGKQVRHFFAQFGVYTSPASSCNFKKRPDSMKNISLRSKIICYELVGPAQVKLSVIDLRGRKLSLIDKQQPAGSHSFDLRDCPVSRGVYVLHFEAGSIKTTRVIMIGDR